jgi:hypothetical protein
VPGNIGDLQKGLPKFDGSKNFDGFRDAFNLLCNEAGLNEREKRNILIQQVRGAAQDWLFEREGWINWSYPELLRAFEREYINYKETSVARLENLKFNNDIHKFNQDFNKIGTGCKRVCPEAV